MISSLETIDSVILAYDPPCQKSSHPLVRHIGLSILKHD